MATSPDDIKAGSYELVALQWDEPTSKPGEPFTFVRHRRGDTVELDEEEARRLVLAGAVVEPGSREKAAAELAKAQFAAALAALPDDLRAEVLGQQAVAADATGFTTPNPPGTAEQGQGIDLSQSVDNIMAAVGTDATVAAQALKQEQAADQPRSTLVSRLQSVVDSASS